MSQGLVQTDALNELIVVIPLFIAIERVVITPLSIVSTVIDEGSVIVVIPFSVVVVPPIIVIVVETSCDEIVATVVPNELDITVLALLFKVTLIVVVPP